VIERSQGFQYFSFFRNQEKSDRQKFKDEEALSWNFSKREERKLKLFLKIKY